MKHVIRLLAIAYVVTLATACSTTHYREAADKEAYAIIKSKTPAVPNMDTDFTIDETPADELAAFPVAPDEDREFLGTAAPMEKDARVITLEQALALAVNHNRTYQNQKEAVFLQALALTLQRHQFDPIFSGSASGTIDGFTNDVSVPSKYLNSGDIVRTLGGLTGTSADLVEQYAQLVEASVEAAGLNQPGVDIQTQESASGVTRFGVQKLLKGGGLIAVTLTSNFFRFLSGDPQVDTTSSLVASFTQPLWRGAGSKVALENLTQAERDTLYTLRDFARYRKEFAVDIASAYFGVLEARDSARNNYRGYQSLLKSAERGRAFASEGRMTPADLGRLEQAALSAESSWINSLNNYANNLDRFKIQLGLPTDAPVVLDPEELENLVIEHPDISADDAVKVAEVTRLDLYNTRDELDDATRKVVVATNNLRPDVDLVTTYRVDTAPDGTYKELDFRRRQWSAGLDVGLPFDRKAERNNYRAALIAEDRARRELDLAEDNIQLQVRDAWRTLDQAKWNYEISLREVDLNARRVEEQDLRAELGLATAIDQVDAQNDLIRSQNNLTSARVNHTIARLAFWRDMGILYIKKDGQWEQLPQEVMPTVRLEDVKPGEENTIQAPDQPTTTPETGKAQ